MVEAPWNDLQRLSDLVAGWRSDWSGRDLFAVSAGRNWVRLHLEGPERTGILLTDVTGARLVCAVSGRLPAPLHDALSPEKQHPLRSLLAAARLEGMGMLPEDKVAAFSLVRPDGTRLVLLHRMFGARCNTVLLDGRDRLLWARHRPPHDLLAHAPPPATWNTGTGRSDDVSAPAVEHLMRCLGDREATMSSAALERRRRSVARLVENLDRDLTTADRGEELRRMAEALASQLHTIEPGTGEVRIPDPRDGSPLVLELDPALTPAANLEDWFRRARKAQRGREVIAERLGTARSEAAELDDAAAALEVAATTAGPRERLAALQSWRSGQATLWPAAAPTRGRHTADEPGRPFRRYLVEDRWEVWVGRSKTENDELTHRASHGRDLWFHAQGVSGSHVILRTGGHPEQVPGRVMEKAARLAALHSKARHSGLVPVMWTERRYVRRPRKAPAGTAVCQREKSLMVEPGIAQGVVTA